MRKYLKIVMVAVLSLLLFPFFTGKAFAVVEKPLNMNTKDMQRFSPDTRTITYQMKIGKKGYQYFDFNYHVNDVNRMGKGFSIKVINEEKKILHEVDLTENHYKSPMFGFKKGTSLFVEIKENFDFIDETNGIDIDFTFFEEENAFYEVEANDESTSATNLINNKTTKGSLNVAGDIDFYKFKIPMKGKTNVIFKATKPDASVIKAGWKLEIFDKNQNRISESAVITTNTHVSEINYGKDEEIYVKIFSADTLNNPEYVSYSLTAATKSGKYSETEGNDSFKKANSLKKMKEGILLTDGDVDFFVFKASKSKTYQIKFSAEADNVRRYMISIFKKAKGKALETKEVNGGYQKNLSLKKNQKVWIKIAGKENNTPVNKKYTLHVNQE